MPATRKELVTVAQELIKRAVTDLPKDTQALLEDSVLFESGLAKTNITAIIDNIEAARNKGVPMCQDTGLPIFFVNIGQDSGLDLSIIRPALEEAVRNATRDVPIRPNVVHPLTRENTGDNVGFGVPVIKYSIIEGDEVELTYMPKGVGSENMSALGMLKPAQGLEGVRKFVIDSVVNAGGNPCPPIVVGVGVGGYSDSVMELAKKALLRPLSDSHPEKVVSDLEKELFENINRLGIGPMGLGGKTTCLGVKVEIMGTHTGALPVGVNIQCWANRRKTARMSGRGVEYVD